MFKNKRGISPLIATVLIIGFTVALAAVIMTWGQTFTKSMSDSTEETTQVQLACAQDVKFGIDSVCYVNDTHIRLTVRNDAGRDIEGITARLKQDPTTIGVIAAKISSGAVDYSGLGELPAFGLKVFEENITRDEIDWVEGDAAKIKEVELVPIILVGEKYVTCSNAIAKYGNVITGDTIPQCTAS